MLTQIVGRLCESTAELEFASPVAHVYRPLEYAGEAHAEYLRRYGNLSAGVLLLGMNPGPWGMCQTGIPFGDVGMVRDWLGIRDGVEKPHSEHIARPILGFDCKRSEVSGTRLWGWARDKYGSPEAFFRQFFVWNYCPLAFLEDSGRNRTPDKLPKGERESLFSACDEALQDVVAVLDTSKVIGVGRFAEARARQAGLGDHVEVSNAPHPSPANPAANRDWAGRFGDALVRAGGACPAPTNAVTAL